MIHGEAYPWNRKYWLSNYEVIIASTRGNIVIMTKCTNVLIFRFQNISDCISAIAISVLCYVFYIKLPFRTSLKFRSEFDKRKIYFSMPKVILHMHNVQCQIFQKTVMYLYLVVWYWRLNECSIWRDRWNYGRNFQHRILNYKPQPWKTTAEAYNLIVKYRN